MKESGGTEKMKQFSEAINKERLSKSSRRQRWRAAYEQCKMFEEEIISTRARPRFQPKYHREVIHMELYFENGMNTFKVHMARQQ